MTNQELLGSTIDNLSPEQINERVLAFMGGIEPPRAKGWLILVALYAPEEDAKIKRSDGTASILAAPQDRAKLEKYVSCTGMVVGLGPLAYVGDKFTTTGPWCRLGEWVTIPRHEGTQINYRGIPMHWIADDRIALGIDDPTYVSRG